MAAVAVGAFGSDGGIVWIVAGLWTIRWALGSSPDVAWGIACLGAGLRWGTTTLADVQAATRLLGPTVATGSPLLVVGSVLLLAAALLELSRRPLRTAPPVARAATVAALVVLIPMYCAPGPGGADPWVVLGWWTGAGIGLALAALLLRPLAARLPAASLVALAAAGILVTGFAR